MKKSIAAIALAASSGSAFGLMMQPVQTKTICLSVYADENDVKYAGSCDESRNNGILGKEILANGCAENQIALTSTKQGRGRQAKFSIEIGACMPPNMVQL